MIRVVLWDFDGVIIDSMAVRDQGFRQIFNCYPKGMVEDLIRYHRQNAGLSRFHKIRYFYTHILGKEITDEKVYDYAEQFSQTMRKILINHQYLIGETIAYIEKNHTHYQFHIVSGSEEKELNYLCQELGIDQYFKTIEGSPTPKKQLVENILKVYGYDRSESILIGDSINDYEAAVENGISFYGYNNPELKVVAERYIDTFRSWEL